MADLLILDTAHPQFTVSDYSGWDNERRFTPHLILHCWEQHIYVSFKGYDKVWQLLDTIFYKEPLGRKNFNEVLKHRVQHLDETSLQIISGIIQEADLTKIVLQGDLIKKKINKKSPPQLILNVDFTYRHYEAEIHPPLFDTANFLEAYGYENIGFCDFELITRGKKSENQRLIQTFPSIIATKKSLKGQPKGMSVVRCIQLPSGKIGCLSNIVVKHEKYACSSPIQSESLPQLKNWLEEVSRMQRHVSNLLAQNYSIPQWVQKNTTSSTVSYYTMNHQKLVTYLMDGTRKPTDKMEG